MKHGSTGPTPPDRWRKRIRLDRRIYAEAGTICSVTIAVQDRRPIFAQPNLAAAAVQILNSRAAETDVEIYAYCVMPDHVHLVLSPSAKCDVIAFVGQFKNLVQRAAWEQGLHGTFWQKSFWDHFLRSDEDLETVVAYVLDNPVRKGLAMRPEDYPFAGSLKFLR